jgi:dienelactone hydrolase
MPRSWPRLAAGFLLTAGAIVFPQESADRKQAELELLLKVLPPSRSNFNGRMNGGDRNWEAWATRTAELPPDFDSMPSVPGLPDPLMRLEGGKSVPVRTPAEWQKQKKWIREQYEKWVFGKMPPAPDNLRATIHSEKKEGRSTVRDVRLEFGPGHRAVLNIQVIIPEGKGPFPVFLTNHSRLMPRVYTAVRRGYIACVYYATDPNYGHPDDSDKFIEVYPEYDFAVLARWAWSASRAVDYLYTLPEVDKAKIGITGHSRNGKQALLAAAFDERITAAVPTSGNTGEGNPWRYTSSNFAVESIEQITGTFPQWFHPRLRFFAGREHKLPVDQNLLMAMVAPRGLMLHSAYAEAVGSPFGFEQAYRSAQRVYRFLGHPEKLWLHLRAGEHSTTAGDTEIFLNFFDTVFGRKTFPKSETWTHGYTFEGWLAHSAERIDPQAYPVRKPGDFRVRSDGNPITASVWPDALRQIREWIHWALGEEPPFVPFIAKTKLAGPVWSTDGWVAQIILNRPLRAPGMGVSALPFGDGLKGDMYYPLGADGKFATSKLPCVIWLHPYSYATGYTHHAPPPIAELVRRGYAVFAFDQLGFGSRVLDSKDFYRQYPKWSLMGKMVADTRAAVDAASALEIIDPERIFLAGYSLGAKVGLFTAALDERVRGVAAVAGVEALRLDTPSKGAEGVSHYSHLHGLIPRFGFFTGQERRLPIDYDEVIAAIAPRRLLVVSPVLDRYAPTGDVREVVAAGKAVYSLLGAEEAIIFQTPLDFNRFPRETQEKLFEWLDRIR